MPPSNDRSFANVNAVAFARALFQTVLSADPVEDASVTIELAARDSVNVLCSGPSGIATRVRVPATVPVDAVGGVLPVSAAALRDVLTSAAMEEADVKISVTGGRLRLRNPKKETMDTLPKAGEPAFFPEPNPNLGETFQAVVDGDNDLVAMARFAPDGVVALEAPRDGVFGVQAMDASGDWLGVILRRSRSGVWSPDMKDVPPVEEHAYPAVAMAASTANVLGHLLHSEMAATKERLRAAVRGARKKGTGQNYKAAERAYAAGRPEAAFRRVDEDRLHARIGDVEIIAPVLPLPSDRVRVVAEGNRAGYRDQSDQTAEPRLLAKVGDLKEALDWGLDTERKLAPWLTNPEARAMIGRKLSGDALMRVQPPVAPRARRPAGEVGTRDVPLTGANGPAGPLRSEVPALVLSRAIEGLPSNVSVHVAPTGDRGILVRAAGRIGKVSSSRVKAAVPAASYIAGDTAYAEAVQDREITEVMAEDIERGVQPQHGRRLGAHRGRRVPGSNSTLRRRHLDSLEREASLLPSYREEAADLTLARANGPDALDADPAVDREMRIALRQQAVVQNFRFAARMARWAKAHGYLLDRDTLLSLGEFALVRAAAYYKPSEMLGRDASFLALAKKIFVNECNRSVGQIGGPALTAKSHDMEFIMAVKNAVRSLDLGRPARPEDIEPHVVHMLQERDGETGQVRAKRGRENVTWEIEKALRFLDSNNALSLTTQDRPLRPNGPVAVAPPPIAAEPEHAARLDVLKRVLARMPGDMAEAVTSGVAFNGEFHVPIGLAYLYAGYSVAKLSYLRTAGLELAARVNPETADTGSSTPRPWRRTVTE